MPSVAIGIHVHAQPERLSVTLDSLRARTTPSATLLLLPDGPDPETATALRAFGTVAQLGTEQPLGAPACFNRLAMATDADVLVLLESGSVVGPEWLERLLAALYADSRNGLAGPSTNRAWNEQCLSPRVRASPVEIARAAADARQRFGATWRSLEPLHSLADFCYVVRRDVVEAVGAADEAYGLGPCWEMDYNARAARAGFRGVWACSAFVYRAPFTPRRQREEMLRFDASKRRYQDKFCGLRLRGERPDYEPHCRGESCDHFAPAALVEIQRPLPAAPPTLLPSPPPTPVRVSSAPLVSCIMPTRDRGDFALQSVLYFQRQDYPERELIILDDGAEHLASRLPADHRVRYVQLPRGQSIGAKRNRGCELARGSIIAQWDDDDWYAPERLSAQVKPLLCREADITGLTAGVFFVLPRWTFWRCTPELHCRLFVHDVHGGTLVFRRSLWERLARYPHASLAEDALLLHRAIRNGARLHRLSGDTLFVYLRHATNSWSFTCGEYLDPRGWQRVSEPLLLQSDRAFYTARCASGSGRIESAQSIVGAQPPPC